MTQPEKKVKFEGKAEGDEKTTKCEWKVPGYSTTEYADTKHEISSMSSFLSTSNFTMSCSGTEEQEEKEPSTSGCSSFLGHSQMDSQRAKKKERVKEYLKELKSIVQLRKGGAGRMGTLSTLQHVLSSMRRIKEVKQKKLEKPLFPDANQPDISMVTQCDLMHTVYESDSHESLTGESLKSNDELRIILSTGDRTIRTVSGNIKYVLGYPRDSWIGRSFDEFVHKKDLIAFNSFHKGNLDEEIGDSVDAMKEESKIFYFRLRKFKSLGSSGFSLRKQDYYVPFQCMFTCKKMTRSELNKEGTYTSWYEATSTSGNSESPDVEATCTSESPDKQRYYTILYCVPLVTPYSQSGLLPEVKTFETRHTLFCSYCHIQPNTIPLLGYLPQEMIGVSIFDFYHNEDLSNLYKIYHKVISLKGVPYRSGPIRFLAKNGSWITCKTEWSSFVNPWTKRLEFIIGKHTVVKGPQGIDVFSENFHMPTLEDTPDPVLQARQKIKDLLLQPVETVYVGTSPEMGATKTTNGKGKSVAIVESKELLPSTEREEEIPEYEGRELLPPDRQKASVRNTGGMLFKEGTISRAYDQLNYTNCIKKFLLSQPRTYAVDSNIKKGSTQEGEDQDRKGHTLDQWLEGSFDDIVCANSINRHSVDSRSLPLMNDDFWKKSLIPMDSEFDFDISVPKPPSFGSSTKVLVSEQEHRDENLDPLSLREQILLPTSLDSNPPQPPMVTAPASADSPPIMTLTRESLWKHTMLQEQLYIATASPDRTILFTNESEDNENAELKLPQPHGLKRSHSPDQISMERCKTSRHSDGLPVNKSAVSILNPEFPLVSPPFVAGSGPGSPNSQTHGAVSMKMFPVVSLHQHMSTESTQSTQSGVQQWPYYPVSGMTLNPQLMVGFHQPTVMQPRMANIGMPVPVDQLNSYMMQHMIAKTNTVASLSCKKQQERKKSQHPPNSESSTEDTNSSLYLLESENNIKLAYNHLVMQSLALQMNQQALSLPPWLENLCFTENTQMKHHISRTSKWQLKKDREVLEKIIQPDTVIDQLDQLLDEIDQPGSCFMDEEQDYVFYTGDRKKNKCSCSIEPCCTKGSYNGHGIMNAVSALRKAAKKEKRGKGRKSSHPETVLQTEELKMDVDSERSSTGSGAISLDPVKIDDSKTESCSSKSESNESSELPCDMRSLSAHSLNTCSEFTPSDQRSNNENESSMKESDGDAMSKKSDSISSDKQQNLEYDSEDKGTDTSFEKLFCVFDVCFPHMHKNVVPWLADVQFTDDLKMKFTCKPKDHQETLKSDRQRLQEYEESGLIEAQLNTFITEFGLSSTSRNTNEAVNVSRSPRAESDSLRNGTNQSEQLGQNLLLREAEQTDPASNDNSAMNVFPGLPSLNDEVLGNLFSSMFMNLS